MSKYFIDHAPVKPEPPKKEDLRVVEEFAGEPTKGNWQVGEHVAPNQNKRRGNS